MLSGPLGMMWRTPRVFISRCTIRLGQMVCIVTDQGESNSLMNSRKRSSRRRRPSWNDRISFLFSSLTVAYLSSLLAEAMVPWRPWTESTSMADLLPATSRPNTTRKECSSVAWYGSFRFSWYIFQLQGNSLR
ncbi:Uncharacterised protein [Bordetella pertussis]|nr:Uncharacterised protein [Bordetella pertussis]